MHDRCVSVERFIPVPPAVVFAVLADPSRHSVIDGSGSVRGVRRAPRRLELGSRFGMSMKLGLPYRIRNRVVEFEEGRRIAWCHPGGHRWRYELVPHDGGTRVIESFDWSTARSPAAIEASGFPERNRAAMKKTLERLDGLVSGRRLEARPHER
ncbi:MAG: SRPBCC family protein [Acidimicrobiia bacterium]